MDFIVYSWFIFFIINAVLIIFRLFIITPSSIKFSIWVKILPLQLLVAVSIIFLISAFNNGSVYNQPKYAILIYVFILYSVYSVFMFRYNYKGKYFCWYNGFFLVKINAAETDKIIMYKNRNSQSSYKVGFQINGKIKMMRNDLGIDSILIKYAKNNRIPVVTKLKGK